MANRKALSCLITTAAILGSAALLSFISKSEDAMYLLVPVVGNLNYFRAVADVSHLFAMLILFYRIAWKRNAFGISPKTQELYLIVFTTRYLDLFTTFYSMYNTVFKIVFIVVTATTRVLVTRTKPYLNDENARADLDGFPHVKWIIMPVAAIALVCWLSNLTSPNGTAVPLAERPLVDSVVDLAWGFSILLEPVAILPQFAMLAWHCDMHWYSEIETLLGRYVFYLGVYRGLYILNWIYRSRHEPYYRHIWLVYAAGIVQSFLYLDFAYYYCMSKFAGRQPVLSPVRFLRQLWRLGIEENVSLRARAAVKVSSKVYPLSPRSLSPRSSHRGRHAADQKALLSPDDEIDGDVPGAQKSVAALASPEQR